MKRIFLTAVFLLSILSFASAQRMLVLPDTPRYANQNKGVWVLRLVDTLPYWSNGRKWIMNASGASALQIRDSLAAYNLRNVTAFNGKVGAVKGVDSIYFTGNDMFWRFGGITSTKNVGGGNWYNIRNAGADNTGATDVSGIINSAISAGIKDIYIPKGKYLLSTPIQLKDSVTILGDGRGLSKLLVNTNIKAIVAGHVKGGYAAQINDIQIEGNRSSGATSAQTGIYLDSVAKVLISNVFISNIGGPGIHIRRNGYCCASYPTTATRGNTVSNCFVELSGTGIMVDTVAEYNTIIGSTLHGNGIGVMVAGGNNGIIGCNIANSTIKGLYLTGGSNNGHGLVSGTTINHNANPLYIDGATLGVSMTGCNIYGEGGDSIVVKNSSNVNIVGGWFYAGTIYYTNSTYCTISATNRLNTAEPVITVGTGEAPTYIKAGKTNNALSWIDSKNATEFKIGQTNGVVTFTGLGTAGIDTTDVKPLGINTSTKEVKPLTYWPGGSGGGGSGTVTSVATNTGSGITGGTITTTGTLAIDTTKIATRLRVQKGIDSLGALMSGGTNFWTSLSGNIYNNTGTNVGVGITAPVSKLQVNGSVRLADTLLFNDGGYTAYPSMIVKSNAATIDMKGVSPAITGTHPGSNVNISTPGGNVNLSAGGQLLVGGYAPVGSEKLWVNGNAQIIGSTAIGASAPAASAALDVQSTTKGFLPPRMTAAQASAISSPAQGLMVFVTTTSATFGVVGWYGWTGSAWALLGN